MASDERRHDRRHLLWFPVRIESDDGDAQAVCQDVSGSGMQIATAESLAIGSALRLIFELPTEPGHVRTLRGHVVRARDNEGDGAGLWPHLVAVSFDVEDEGLAALAKAAARGSEA